MVIYNMPQSLSYFRKYGNYSLFRCQKEIIYSRSQNKNCCSILCQYITSDFLEIEKIKNDCKLAVKQLKEDGYTVTTEILPLLGERLIISW